MMEYDDLMDHKPAAEGPLLVLLGKEQDQWLQAIVQLKRLVIGSNRQKESAILNGVVPRLLEWMDEEDTPPELRTEAAILLGSLAFGKEKHIEQLVNAGCVNHLIRGLSSPNLGYVEACLRCLRTIFIAPNPPVDLLYQDQSIIQHMLGIIHQTTCTKEAVSNILANACKCLDHQTVLLEMGAIPALAPLLGKRIMYKIQMPILKFFASLCYMNAAACAAVLSASVDEEPVVEMIRRLQSRDNTSEMQMAAAKCLTYLHRGQARHPLLDEKVINEVLHTLVRMCKKDRTLEENVEGAETLAFLIQEDPLLQGVSAICDHCIKALADYLGYTDIQQIDSRQTQKRQVNWGNLLKSAAFKAFSAIGANDEEIRKKIISIDNLVLNVVNCMDSEDQGVQAAACRCLHSLTRSVQQLRTTLRDLKIWDPLVKLMRSPDTDVLKIASASMCNMLLEFSPSRDEILDLGVLQVLTQLCQKTEEPSLRLNGVWALMNLSFNSDQAIKMQIVHLLGAELLYSLLRETQPDIVLRTLGLLRNLLSKKHHIDSIMVEYGATALQAVAYILAEPRHPREIKEQTLCVLANIADGHKAKTTVLNNEEVIKQIVSILGTDEIRLQIAAVCVIKNILAGDDEGNKRRMECLRDRVGVQLHLQRLAQSPDAHLQERAKSALRHFL